MDLVEMEEKRKELVKPDKPLPQSQRVTEALNEAFDLVGGIPRMAVWADHPDNQTDFYKLWSKTGQKLEVAHSGEVIIRPALPPSPLDDEIKAAPLEGDFEEIPS